MLVGDQIQILLCSNPIDMRKGADGLAGIVREALGDEPLSGKLFVFQSRSGDRVKLLYWHFNGFAIWSKRIQRGRFRFPKGSNAGAVCLTRSALRMILEGTDFESLQKKKAA